MEKLGTMNGAEIRISEIESFKKYFKELHVVQNA